MYLEASPDIRHVHGTCGWFALLIACSLVCYFAKFGLDLREGEIRGVRKSHKMCQSQGELEGSGHVYFWGRFVVRESPRDFGRSFFWDGSPQF